MTWLAPDIVPADEPFHGGERETLQGFLQYARESLLKRCAGQDVAPLYWTPEHPDRAFDDIDPGRAADDIAWYRAEWSAVNEALDRLALDDTYTSPRWGVMSLRWAYLHMIREYSAHGGQADIIRERIDGPHVSVGAAGTRRPGGGATRR